MDIEKKLDALKKIRPVEAPPFLLTRIEAAVTAGNETVNTKWRLSAAVGFAILLLLNIYVITKSARSSRSNGIETVVAGMQLSNSNNLYDE